MPQLRALQTRLTSELEHLTSSHTKLRAAQTKFQDCVRSINEGVIGSKEKGTDGKDEILVPLTSSLYVKGSLADREKVLVDVGTGFYVEKVCSVCRSSLALGISNGRTMLIYVRGQTTAKATEFYNGKIKGLESNLKDLAKVVQSKDVQLRAIEDGKSRFISYTSFWF